MQVTATEFKQNLGRYLEKSREELIVITQYGKPIARLSGIGGKSSRLIDQIAGTMPATMTAEEALAGRAGD